MIEVENLFKVYGNHIAVDHLSFMVEKGQIYGFLGPNGAGKTTTMNIITGFISATSGRVKVGGFDIFEEPKEAKRLIGYMPETPPLYGEMTPLEYLKFVAELKKVDKKEQRRQIETVMRETQIEDMGNRLIRHLSKGYRQRVGLAQALLGDPQVLILDEPTVGLDPKQIIEIRDLIKALAKKHTIILSSHILSEVSAVCDHVMIISKGCLVANDTPEKLSQMMRGYNTLVLKVRTGAEKAMGILSRMFSQEKIQSTACEGGCTDLLIQTELDVDPREDIFFAFADLRIPILEMKMTSMSLEDVFLELTSDKQEEPAAAESGQKNAEKEGTADVGDI